MFVKGGQGRSEELMMTTERPRGLRFALRNWMRPPRPHGETIEGRVVSSLELFYDLVFVVFVSQVAHALAPQATQWGSATSSSCSAWSGTPG